MKKKTEVIEKKPTIPRPPIKEGFKQVFLWFVSYKTKSFIAMILAIMIVLGIFSVVSVSCSRDAGGKLKIDKVEVVPIDTKVDIGLGKE